MRVWLFALGCLSMLGQVVLLREVSVACSGSELVLVLALGVWLVAVALGALAVRRERHGHERDVRRSFLLFAVLLAGALLLLRGARRLLHAVPGSSLPFPTQMMVLAVCLAPVAGVLGMLFVRCARRYAASHGTLSRGYALESAGGLGGGAAATLLLAAGVPNLHAAGFCAALGCAAAAWPWRRRAADAKLPAALALLLLAGTLAGGSRLDRWSTGWNHPRLLATRDTPYGRVTLTEAAGQVAVFEDDALVSESQSTAGEAFVHVAVVQRDAVARVLVLGGAVPGLLTAVLAHGPEVVDDVELSPRVLEIVTAHGGAALQQARADPRLHVHLGDPRRFLSRAGHYDLLLVGMPEPESARANRYYTREFFALAARHLAPGGVLALRLRGSENIWTPSAARRLASVEAALQSVFPAVVVVPGGTTVLLASGAALGTDPGPLSERLRARQLASRLVTPAYLRYLYTNDRFAEVQALLQHAEVPANSDLQPACYQTAMLLWLARFYPRFARLELQAAGPAAWARSPWGWGAGVLLLAALLLARRRPVWRAGAFAALAGLAGMMLEAVLLLRYQAQTGVLYQDLGILLTAFMLGLTAGAEAVHRRITARHSVPGLAPAAGLSVAGGLAVVALAVGALVHLPASGHLATAGLLLACAGAGVGAAFGCATARARVAPQVVVSPVYAADLLGGAAGSLVAALWLIPAWGMGATAVAAAVASLLALLCA